MISEIQTKLQKHNKVVFVVLLAVIIVAFVFTIGAAPGLGDGERAARQDFFGYNLQSERDVREITRLGQTSYRIEHGAQQPEPNQFQSYVLERVAYLALADELRIPGPTEDQLRHFVTGRTSFQDEDGRFDPIKYSTFIDEIEADPQTTTDDVAWVLEQDYRIDKARGLVSGPGYVMPTEARLQLERNQTLWSLDLATLDLSAFQPEIEVSDEKLEAFFLENSFRYERDPRTSFSYAVFPEEAFLDRVKELSEDELQAHFEQNRDRFTPEPPAEAETTEEGEEAEEPAEQPETTLADVRDEVEASLRRERARRIAGTTASDFAYAMFQQKVRPGSPEFDDLLKNHRGELREAPPASPSEFPPELGFSREVQQKVFRLNEDRDFSDPLLHGNDYIVLFYKETLPSFVPPMEEVREVVERDYRNEERRRLLSEKGQEVRENLRQRMEEGASFIEAAEAEELTTQSVDKFSRIAPPEQVNPQLISRLDEFNENEVSQMIQLQSFGYFIYLKDREVPEIDTTSDEFVRTEDNLRMWSSMANSNSLLEEYIEREMMAGNPPPQETN